MGFKRIWNGSMIIDHIMQRHGKEALNSHYYASNYPDVYAAAERIFGSWGEAIEACGLNYDDIRKYKVWSRQTVLDAIRKRQAQGFSMSSKALQEEDKPLYMAAIKRFGSWGKAVGAAGLDYKKFRVRRSMNKEEVKSEILSLYRENQDLSYCNMRKNYQYLLAAGMRKLGDGSWAKARKECGILTNYRLIGQQRATRTAKK